MKAEATITSKRQVTIPMEIYKAMGLNNSDKLIFEINDNNEVILRKKTPNKLNLCPICQRYVKNEEDSVVKNFQKYHLACWSTLTELGTENLTAITTSNLPTKYNNGVIHYNLTTNQMRTITKISYIAAAYKVDISRTLKDNEAIIMTPAKLKFMTGNQNSIGEVIKFNSDEIFRLNSKISDLDENCNEEYNFDDVVSNKLTKTQIKSLSRILLIVESSRKDMIEKMDDNEVVIMLPTKIVFMESKPGLVGMVEEYNSKYIFASNSEETFVYELTSMSDTMD